MTRARKGAKVLALFLAGLTVCTVSVLLPPLPVSAERDEAVYEIASYRMWTKITKEPIKGAPAFDVSTTLSTVDVTAIGGG